MQDLILPIASMIPLAAGFGVGKRKGLIPGLATGLVVFIILVFLLVSLGYT